MNPELPDLEPPNPAREFTVLQIGQFRTFLYGLGVLAPLPFVYGSIATGMHIWLALLNLVGMYSGLTVVVLGSVRKRRRLVDLGAAGMLVSFIAFLAVHSLMS